MLRTKVIRTFATSVFLRQSLNFTCFSRQLSPQLRFAARAAVAVTREEEEIGRIRPQLIDGKSWLQLER
jgi:hypothetical protein